MNPAASPWLRLGAWTCDAFLVTWLCWRLATPAALLLSDPFAEPERNWAWWLAFIFLWPATWFAYHVGFLAAWHATPGKLMAGLRVVSLDGGAPALSGLVRRAFASFGAAALMALLVPTWTFGDPFEPKDQWHDTWSGTREVAVPRTSGARTRGVLVVVVLLGAGIAIPAVSEWRRAALRSSRPPVARLVDAGNEALSRGDLPAALAAFDAAVKADPTSVIALVNRGAVHGDMGQLDLQVADCNRVLELEPDQPFALLGRANAHRLRGQWAEAEADYTAVIRVRPDWSGLVYAHRGRGAVRFLSGRLDDAAADFAEGSRVGVLHSVGSSDHAKGARFLTAIAMCDLFRSEALQRMGDIEEAREARETSILLKLMLPTEADRTQSIEEWLTAPAR